jgi:putative ABC transport system permease protein
LRIEAGAKRHSLGNGGQESVMKGLRNRTLVFRSLLFFRRSHFSLALGVAAATAVIVGALVVGDSVRGSLRRLVLQRLSNIVAILQSRHFFDPAAIDPIEPSSVDRSLSIAPVVLLSNCSAEHAGPQAWGRASRVQVVGIDDRFLSGLDSRGRQELERAPGADEVVINESLARELKVEVGDEITLRISQDSGIPADNLLGRRDQAPIGLPRQEVVGIIGDDQIGGLQLQSNQEAVRNVFTSLESLQDLLEVGPKVNAALVLSSNPSNEVEQRELTWVDSINRRFRPALEDYGLQLDRHSSVYPDRDRGETAASDSVTVFDYFQISSTELLIDEATAVSIMDALAALDPYRTYTYLANATSKVQPLPQEADRRIREQGMAYWGNGSLRDMEPSGTLLPPLGRVVPYSIIVGISSDATDLAMEEFVQVPPSSIRAPYCWVNSWLADELDLRPGQWIQIQYYEPETVDGELVESFIRLMVAGIVPIVEPDTPHRRNRPAIFSQKPTRFNDPDLTPVVPGITDQETIANWDVPFDLEQRDLILPQDDKYWENHRLTPKILLPYTYARNLFRSRFGATTAIRIPADSKTQEDQIRRAVEGELVGLKAESGLHFRPVRFQQLSAASGTTPFDMLFLSLSFFVIVAALLLVSLLFRLGIQQRMGQLGIFQAQGFTARRIRRILLGEMSLVIALGALLGVPLGLGYARLMIAGLETWWIGAIQSQFLQFYVSPSSAALGVLGGILACLATIFVTLRGLSSMGTLQLLRGDEGGLSQSGSTANSAVPGLAGICLVGALLLLGLAFGQLGMLRAGFFFGSGMLLLVSCVLALSFYLSWAAGSKGSTKQGLISLSIRAISRNPVRSSLSAGLLAVASFLIASMSVFHASPNPMGYGTFDLIGISSQPIFENLGSPAARSESIGAAANDLLGSTIIPVRMSEGEDASCTNLYQVNRPNILGLSDKLQKLSELTSDFRFSWVATADPISPWAALQAPATGDKSMPIPVILDQNTALWSLKQGGSLFAPVEVEIDGKQVHFQVVGLLSNSILQGHLVISERNFERLFPRVSGYRFFFIRSGDNIESQQVEAILEKGWDEFGMDIQSSQSLMARLLSVQNTYISAFQTLGALGLLLGTFGLAAVQLRSVVERRRELALMQAVGFSRWRLGQLLTLETVVLLSLGLLIGVLCSALALVPYVVEVGPQLSVLSPLLMMAVVFLCGLLAAFVAVRFALRLPLLQTLRGE